MYGYSKDFIADICQIINSYGWQASEQELLKNGKVNFVAGATLTAPDSNWNLNVHGSIWINYDLHNTAGAEKTNQFILSLVDKMVERLKIQ